MWLSMQPEDLRQAVLEVLNNRLNPRLTAKAGMDVQLRTAVEGLAYEDWTIDYQNVGNRDACLRNCDRDSWTVELSVHSLSSYLSARMCQLFLRELIIMFERKKQWCLSHGGACVAHSGGIIRKMNRNGVLWCTAPDRGTARRGLLGSIVQGKIS